MTAFRRLSDAFAVSPQIQPDEVAGLRERGFTTIINNRPDGEDPRQPEGQEIERAAVAAGLSYLAIPVAGGFADADVAALRAAIDNSGGPVFAFCRTGTRSTLLWALAQASKGVDPEEIASAAASAGYDIAPVRAMVEKLAASS